MSVVPASAGQEAKALHTIASTTCYYEIAAAAVGVDSPLSAPVVGQPNEIVLTNGWDGNQLQLSWPGGGTFLAATNVTRPWTTNARAVSPFSVAPIKRRNFTG
jgi:hypothetical protein